MRALTLLPVLGRTHGAAWVARAGEVTVRRLVAEVEWALEAGGTDVAPPPPGDDLVPPERQMRASEGEIADASIRFRAPASVVGLFRTALAAFTCRGDPVWKGCAHLLAHVVLEWRSQPRHRDPIFVRDGWRCAVPACTSRGNLHDHHVLFRSQGGGDGQDNRIAVCAWHHLRGLHQGRVRARGRAPREIVSEVGVRRGYPPLLRAQGDRYVITPAT